MIGIPLGFEDARLEPQALTLVTQYGFQIAQDVLPRLQLTHKLGLVLLMDHFLPLHVDFNVFLNQRRLDKKHGLVRACKPAPGMTILDVTAGWGRDAGLLAQHGAKLILVERQAMMAALLKDGLSRLVPNVLDISLVYQDARIYVQSLSASEFPDVIYMDPMHPERLKAALVKKDMQALQQLLGPDEDVESLLDLSIVRAKHRVVLKWPQRLTPPGNPKMRIEGKTVSFAVY